MSFLVIKTHAQQIEITNIQRKGPDITIQYNLADERIDRSYSVYLYTSKDSYIKPMEKVSGDVGVDIPIGENRKMVWHAKEELGADFSGDLSLEIKGNFYIPFITLDGVNAGQVFVRGQANDFIWSGGRGDNILNFELYKGDQLVKSFEERPNNGNTSLTIPIKVKPGDNYRFRISDKRNRDDVIYTDRFVVKRRIPLSIQLGGAVIVGAGIGILIQSLIPEKPIGDPVGPNDF
jgi:hypothetical protein